MTHFNNKKTAFFITAVFSLSTLLGLFNVSYAASNFDRYLSYQGKLTNSAGATVADADYTMRFRLYTTATGGTAIFDETLLASTTDGIFSSLIGQSSSTASLNFNQNLYLGVSVNADPEMVPRKQLTPAPFAYTSDKLDGFDSTDFVSSISTTSIATTSADTVLTINQSGAGDIFSAKKSGSAVFTITNNSRVGIGTTSPYATLSVVGETVSTYFTATSTTASTFPYASTTALTISGNSYLGTVSSGVWNGTTIGDAYITKTGAWTGTFDGLEGVDYIANSFSTTSANHWGSLSLGFSTTSSDFWKTQNNFFSTTSASAWSTLGLGFSTTSANYWSTLNLGFSTTSATFFANASTTIPKTYADNTFTGLNIFANASTTQISASSFSYLGTVRSGTWNGTAIGSQYGGTGQNLSSSNGVLNYYGGVAVTIATSSLGLLTTNVAEGTNKYWTNTRFDERLSATTSLPNLSEVGTVASGTWNGDPIGATFGGTGITSYSVGQILYADSPTTLATLNPGSLGTVLKMSGGVPMWAVESGGGGSGSGVTPWATSSDNLSIFPFVPTNSVIVGGSATTVEGVIFEVIGNSRFGGTLTVTGKTTLVNASTTQISASSFSYLGTVRSGTWNGTTIGDAYLTKTGAWTGTFDGLEGTDYIASSFSTTSADAWSTLGYGFSTTSADHWISLNGGSSFSTTSADAWSKLGYGFSTTSANHWSSLNLAFSTSSSDYWKTQNNFFSTTSADYWSTEGLGFSTTSAIYFANASTTIPKTYADNTFTGLNIFANASTTQISASGFSYLGTVRSGTWNGTTIGDAYITKSGAWTGTFDGLEGTDYIAGSFSTTSADAWSTLGYGFSTTSADHWISLNGGSSFSTTSSDHWYTLQDHFSTTSANAWSTEGLGFSTTSAIYFANASTTIPKTYTANTFTELQTFNANATTTGLTVTGSTYLATVGGNVGIGTTSSPIGKLYVTYDDSATLVNSVSPGIAIQNTNNTAGALNVLGFLNYDGFLGAAISTKLNQSGNNGNNLIIQTKRDGGSWNTDQFVVATTSNIGIGTSSPNWRLSVAGDGSFDDYVRASYFTATSTSATSTFAGGISATGLTYLDDTRMTGTLDLDSNGILYSGVQAIKSSTIDGADNGRLTLEGGGSSAVSRGGFIELYGNEATGEPGNVVFYAGTGGSTYVGSGNFGVGTSTPWGKLSVTQTGTAGLPAFVVEDSASPDSSPFIIDQTGNVGIGTTTPIAKLDVLSAGGSDTAGSGLIANLSYVAGSSFGLRYNAAGSVLNMDRVYGGAWSNIMSWDRSNGNVGVGTSSPMDNLAVLVGNTAYKGLTISATGAGGRPRLTLLSDTNNEETVADFTNANQSWRIGNSLSVSAAFQIKDITSNTVMMTIKNSTGNVGIGTTTPWGLLSVNPNDTTGPSFVIGSSTATKFIVDNGGFVGVGVAKPLLKLDVTGAASLPSSSGQIANGILSLRSASSGEGLTMGVDSSSPYGGWIQGQNTAGSTARPLYLNPNGGNVGIGTTSPGSQLDVSTSAANPATLSITGGAGSTASFGLGYASQWYANTSTNDIGMSFAGASSDLYIGKSPTVYMTLLSGGNVGIGTTTPLSLLNVAGITAPKITISDTNASANQKHWFMESDTGQFSIGTTSDNLVTNTTYRPFVIEATGDVGIGTVSPSYGKLEIGVSSLGTNALLALSTADGTYNPRIILSHVTSATSQYLKFDSGYTTGIDYADWIFNTGSVGIGTTTPGASLEVYNNITDYAGYFNNNYGTTPGTVGKGLFVRTGGNDADDIIFNARGYNTDVFRILGNGTVGIGTTTPATNLQIYGTDAAIELGSVYDNWKFLTGEGTGYDFAIQNDYHNGSGQAAAFDTRMTITYDGKVGIGTTSPTAKLHVYASSGNGEISVDATAASQAQYAWRKDNVAKWYAYVPASSNDLQFWDTAARLTIESGGDVGVGTSTPQVNLEVGNTSTGQIASYVTNANSGVGAYTEFNVRNGYANADGMRMLALGTGFTTNGIFVQDSGVLASDLNLSGGLSIGTRASAPMRMYIAGTEYARFDTSGRFGIGTTTPVSTLSVQGSLCVRNTGSCGTTAGTIYATTATITDIDLAENYRVADSTIEAGEIVSIDISQTETVKRAEKDDDVVVGIISTAPGLLLGNEIPGGKPVALSGRVPVKVNLENGPIAIGDRISISSTAGVGMKMSSASAQSIGVALESYNGEPSKNGKIVAFVNLSWNKLDDSIADAKVNSNLWLTDDAGRIKMVSAGALDMQAKDITNVGKLLSASGKWSMSEEGVLVVEEVKARKLCLGLTCVNEDQLKALLLNVETSNSTPVVEPSSPQNNDFATTTDTVAPVIHLNGDANITFTITIPATGYADPDATVTDNKDANLGIQYSTYKDNIKLSDTAEITDTSTPATYEIHYNATDQAGNKATEVIRTVNYIEPIVIVPPTVTASSTDEVATTTEEAL